jgi:hypothetical protein
MKQFEISRPGDINVTALVGDGDDPVEFVTFADSPRSTADPESIARLRRRGIEVVSTTMVRPRTLASVLDAHLPADTNIDLLSIDVENLDLAVLKTSDWSKYRPSLVCVEDNKFRDADGDTDIRSFMRNVGYRLASHCFDTTIYAEARK